MPSEPMANEFLDLTERLCHQCRAVNPMLRFGPEVLLLIAEVRRLRAENDALRQQVAAQQAAANADRATASELLGRRAEKPLAWSKEPPTVPGWYWWRIDTKDEGECVRLAEVDGKLYWRFAGTSYVTAYDMLGGQWACPLDPPAC